MKNIKQTFNSIDSGTGTHSLYPILVVLGKSPAVRKLIQLAPQARKFPRILKYKWLESSLVRTSTRVNLILFLMIFLTSFLLAGDKIEIVTTLPDFKNFAEVIGGNAVHVVALASARQDPHHFEIKPSDVMKVKKADMLIINGLELDNYWIAPLMENSRNPKIQKGMPGFVDASEGIQVLEVPQGKVDRSMGDIHAGGNPHYNLSPVQMRLVFLLILESLKKTAPEQAAYFQKNAETYLRKLDSKISEWKTQLKTLPNKKIVSFHSSWIYFFKDMGLDEGGYLEPKPGIAPSPKHLQELVERMKKEKSQVILKESFHSDEIPNFVAQKTGARVEEVFVYSEDYIEMIDRIVKKITLSFPPPRG